MMFQKRKRKKKKMRKTRLEIIVRKKEREKMKAKNKIYYKRDKKSTREWDSEGGNLYTQCKRLGE